MEQVEDRDEQLLLQQLSEGNAEAFRHLYVRYYPKIFYFVQGLLKSEMDTEDVVQEIFSKLWVNRTSVVNIRNFDSYLFILSKNMTLNYLEIRNRREGQTCDEFPDELDDHSPHELLVAKDLQLLADLVVSQMPPQRRLVYELSREDGLSNAEIANKLQLSPKTVENHLNLALKELRKALLLWMCLFFHTLH